MIRFRDIFTADSGIFTNVFAVEQPTAFAAIFGDTTAAELDLYAYQQYADKLLMPYITDSTYYDTVKTIISVCLSKWESIADAMQAEYSYLEPVRTQRTYTDTKTVTSSTSDSNVKSIKVYNDDDYNDNERNTGTGTGNRTDTDAVSEDIKGIGSGVQYSDVIQKEIELRNYNYKHEIVKDLINNITLSIY